MYISSWGEEIFIRNLSGNDFIEVIMAGVTHPNPSYRIAHNVSKKFPYDYYVFEHVIKGTGYIETPEHKYTVKEGDFYFLNKLRQHIYYSDPDEPYEKIFIVLKGSFVDSLVENYHLNDSVYIQKCSNDSVLSKIFTHLTSDRPLDYDLLAIETLKMFQQVFPSPHQKQQPMNRVAEMVKNYIDNHITEKITLEAISKDLFISKSHIEYAFKEAYNQTPIAYYSNQKITLAASMLITTDYSVTQIAHNLGFSDVKYMSKCFKKVKGKTPTQYKKEKLLSKATTGKKY